MRWFWPGRRSISADSESSRPLWTTGAGGGDPLYGIRRILRTGQGLLTDRQAARLQAVFACDAHVELDVTCGVYQKMVTAAATPFERRASP